jgi:hypothetical protein
LTSIDEEFLSLAVAAADSHSGPSSWLLAELILELARANRSAEALARLQRLEPSLVACVTERLGHPAFVAEQLLPFIALEGDAALAARLLDEVRRLLMTGRDDDHVLALLRVARTIDHGPTLAWLAALKGEPRLLLDLAELERLKSANDPAWERAFDLLEARLDDPARTEREHGHIYGALLRCGLTRAAHRHWAQAGAPLNAQLLAALWTEGPQRTYRDAVERIRTRWVESSPRDWTWVGTAVDLALAQKEAGDLDGALVSASGARALAEENATRVVDLGLPPAVAIWSLANLFALEVSFGHEPAARQLFARCQQLLDAPMPANAGKSWRQPSTRTTTLLSFSKGCERAGWYDEALALARLEKDPKIRLSLQRNAASRSPPAARALIGSLTDPLQRLELALAVVKAAAPGRATAV